MALLAGSPDRPVSTREIASTLRGSEAHLSKVLQRLSRVGLVRATRGPKGGFTLEKAPHRITLLEVYEAIEGPLSAGSCLLGTPICGGNCILGDLLSSVNEQVKARMGNIRLSDLAGVFAEGRSTRDPD
jgi:Rrf2 family protein